MDDALVADDGRAESDTARHGAGSHADTAPPTATGASTSHADGRLASLVALGALAVALATVVAFVLRDPGGQGPPTPSPPPAAPAPEPARTAPDEPEPPPSTPTVRIRVRTEPANAELRLDGEPVANPFDADLPQDDEPLTFEARAEGYATARRELVPRFAQRVSLALEPEVPDRPGQGRPARPSAAAGRTRGTPEPAEASPATEAVPSEADPAEAPEPDTSDEGDEEIQRIRF